MRRIFKIEFFNNWAKTMKISTKCYIGMQNKLKIKMFKF